MTEDDQSHTVTLALFKTALAELVGRQCWSVSFDQKGPTGTDLVLEFEPRIRRVRPIPNDALSMEEQEFEGEFALMAFGKWLFGTVGTDAVASDSAVAPSVDQLRGQTVMEASCDEASLRTTLAFDSSSYVTLEPDTAYDDSPPEAHTLFTLDRMLSVTRDRTVLLEPRRR